LVGYSFEWSNRSTKKNQIKTQSTSIFFNFSKVKKNEEKSQKTLLKCRKWHFLEILSLQTGEAGYNKVGNQILPQIHIK